MVRGIPEGAQSFNPFKLLLDPTAGVEGDVLLSAAIHGHEVDENLDPTETPFIQSTIDSAPYTARSCCSGDLRSSVLLSSPRTPWNETVIYELHVKGFTKQMEGVPAELRALTRVLHIRRRSRT